MFAELVALERLAACDFFFFLNCSMYLIMSSVVCHLAVFSYHSKLCKTKVFTKYNVRDSKSYSNNPNVKTPHIDQLTKQSLIVSIINQLRTAVSLSHTHLHLTAGGPLIQPVTLALTHCTPLYTHPQSSRFQETSRPPPSEHTSGSEKWSRGQKGHSNYR